MRSVGPTGGPGTTEHAARRTRERGSESGVPRSLAGADLRHVQVSQRKRPPGPGDKDVISTSVGAGGYRRRA